MHANAEPRRWMRELADVRLQASRLGTRAESRQEALDVARRALDLADTIRANAAAAHQRCLALEQQLAAREGHDEQILDMVPIAVVTTSTQGTVLHANPAACALFGRGKATMKRQPLLHHAEDREAFCEIVRQLPGATGSFTASVRIRPCNRAPLDVAVTLVRDVTDGSRWHWFVQPVVPGLLGDR
jgi:PAS domain-containing protein